HRELDLDLLANQDTTGLQRLVPRHAEILAVDLGAGGEGHHLLAPWADGDAFELDVEGHLARDVPDGELTDELELLARRRGHAGAAEGQPRVLLHVEEVAAAQVVVTVCHPGVDARGRDVHGHTRGERIPGNDHFTTDLRERTAYLAHHEVASDEADLGVRRVDAERARRRDRKAGVRAGGRGCGHLKPPEIHVGQSI